MLIGNLTDLQHFFGGIAAVLAKLGTLFSNAWFGKALLPRLQFNALEEENAITILAEACSATPEYKKELRMILDFMVAGGIIKREGNMIKPIECDNRSASRIYDQARNCDTVSLLFISPTLAKKAFARETVLNAAFIMVATSFTGAGLVPFSLTAAYALKMSSCFETVIRSVGSVLSGLGALLVGGGNCFSALTGGVPP